jgi:hypothetical protein
MIEKETNKHTNYKPGGTSIFQNLSVPYGSMLLMNDHRYLQKYAIDMNSSRTLDIKDPLFDNLLNKIKK